MVKKMAKEKLGQSEREERINEIDLEIETLEEEKDRLETQSKGTGTKKGKIFGDPSVELEDEETADIV